MKTFKKIALAVALLVGLSLPVAAQTFGGVTTTYTTNFVVLVGPGQTNVPAYNSSGLITNFVSVALPSKSLTITNLDNGQTNIYGFWLQTPGATNLIPLAFVTNVYSAGTTNQTIAASGASVGFPLIMSAQILGAHTNGFYAQ